MRTAVVTGAARGLGRAMAERLVADGFTVWAVDRDEAELSRTAARSGRHRSRWTSPTRRPLDDLVTRVGSCDALVNNAAIWRFTPLATTPIDEARQVLDVNVIAPLLWMQRFLPLLRAKRPATIVNISSITAAMSPTGTGLYPPSKAALEAMTRMAAVEFGPRGHPLQRRRPGHHPDRGHARPLRRRGDPRPARPRAAGAAFRPP